MTSRREPLTAPTESPVGQDRSVRRAGRRHDAVIQAANSKATFHRFSIAFQYIFLNDPLPPLFAARQKTSDRLIHFHYARRITILGAPSTAGNPITTNPKVPHCTRWKLTWINEIDRARQNGNNYH
jgi:hypothetical protein